MRSRIVVNKIVSRSIDTDKNYKILASPKPFRAPVCVCVHARVCVCVWERERERERQTDRQTDRQIDRHRNRDRYIYTCNQSKKNAKSLHTQNELKIASYFLFLDIYYQQRFGHLNRNPPWTHPSTPTSINTHMQRNAQLHIFHSHCSKGHTNVDDRKRKFKGRQLITVTEWLKNTL